MTFAFDSTINTAYPSLTGSLCVKFHDDRCQRKVDKNKFNFQCPMTSEPQHQLENWHSQRGPRWGACHFDLWPFDPKIYRCLPFPILYLCMKYEVCRLREFWVIALQQSVDGQMDRRADRQTDRVITIGLPHLRWRGPNKANPWLIETWEFVFQVSRTYV